jgi:hypothetical protein
MMTEKAQRGMGVGVNFMTGKSRFPLLRSQLTLSAKIVKGI